ncbi:MAG: aspartate ammonia-lyase [Spartobacteria bacterium]|nr:aspartate ammonia-lyase [Spartobacteria bacterium]
MDMRTEKDYLGCVDVPVDANWGIHTARSCQNFQVSGCKTSKKLIFSLILVKKACILANLELNYLSEEVAKALLMACDEVLGLADGENEVFFEDFPLDALQGGAGTSTNMNVNEVLANRALRLLGHAPGAYDVIHPLDHVNLHQSTNDTYPTALKIAAIYGFRELSHAVARLQGSFQSLEKKYADFPTIGKTERVKAVPITWGAQFSSFAEAFARDRWRTFKCEERLRVVNLGGTAVGTGLAAPRRYIFLVIEKLREVTGLGLSRAENLPDQTANADVFVEVSGMLKALAVNLIKVSDDLRLLQMTGELSLPAAQPGSSIMPGKINPVIPECMIQVGLKVCANDTMVADCASRGSLQICEFLPLAAHALLESLDMLQRALPLLAAHVEGITVDEDRCRELFSNSPEIITAFLPEIGYDRAAELLKAFERQDALGLRPFLEMNLGRERVDRTLSPQSLTALGYKDTPAP